MCGIIGAIEVPSSTKLDFTSSGQLYKYIAPRGPDFYDSKSEFVKDYKVSFGHARLAIIDLTAASNQPMCSRDGRFMLTYNGEIYNFKEIRSELIAQGISFDTEGDTEVVLKSWEYWGPACLNKFNGMFAFGLLDKIEQELYLVRDRFGVKPLVYGQTKEGTIIFSSAISSVAAFVGKNIDQSYCSVGLRYGFYEGYEDHTPFKTVKYVTPGTYLKCSLSKGIAVEKYTWYSLDEAVSKKEKELLAYTDEELLDLGKDLLFDAVKVRLRSDVPVAVSLSGGVDSSSIASIASNEINNLTGFTYGNPNNANSEGPLVDLFAKRKGIKVNYIFPELSATGLRELFERTENAQDAPFIGLSILAQQEVYRVVKEQGFKVLLGGQGGDEIFAGYRKFFLVALRNAVNSGNPKNILQFLYSFGILLFKGVGNYKLYWAQRNRYFNRTGKKIFLLPNLPAIKINLLGERTTLLNKRQILDIQRYSLPTLLRYEDRNSMSFGVESRLPFMDYRLVEFALALPATLKIKEGLGKWALREMVASEVPAYILKNKVKVGFEVTQDWINKGLGEVIRAKILDNKKVLEGFVENTKTLEKWLQNDLLSTDRNLLSEALLLTFLAKPITQPTD